MKEIKFKNKEYQERFDNLLYVESKKLTDDQYLLIKIIMIHYKKYSTNEYYLLLALLRGLVFFKGLDINDKCIEDSDREKLIILSESFSYEIWWDREKYLASVLKMSNNLFLLKMIIKYTILSFEDKYIDLIPNIWNYYKSIWYIIPYLTLKEINLLWFFQDKYFEKVYPKEFSYTKKHYFKKINNTIIPWEYLVYVVNNLSDLMSKAWVIWRIKLRKKSFFSVYNKLIRKATQQIDDSIWIRVIFSNTDEINIFTWFFEDICFCVKKKDYIKKPKKNWYKSIHYTYLSPYEDRELKIELQLRTTKIDKQIKKTKDLSHYTYTLKENKWADLFEEVHLWYDYINKIKKT